jgi:hypothetical protein
MSAVGRIRINEGQASFLADMLARNGEDYVKEHGKPVEDPNRRVAISWDEERKEFVITTW